MGVRALTTLQARTDPDGIFTEAGFAPERERPYIERARKGYGDKWPS
jgi:hypothetical protein